MFCFSNISHSFVLSLATNDFLNNSFCCQLGYHLTYCVVIYDNSYPYLFISQGECVKLTSEEYKMLQRIGCQLPIKFPLSQTNEKAIRTVRRKIRNKLSAQASRAKRQRYVIDLERRYSMCTEEIKQLRRQVYELEEDKR